MGWTLGRYFLLPLPDHHGMVLCRYFRAGLHYRFHRILQQRWRAARLYGKNRACGFGAQNPDGDAAGRAFHRSFRRNGDAGFAQPQIRARDRACGRHFGMAVPASYLHRGAAFRVRYDRDSESHCRLRSVPRGEPSRLRCGRATRTPSRPSAHPGFARRRTRATRSSAPGRFSTRVLNSSDAVFFQFDENGEIIRRIDAKHAFLRDGYWELTRYRAFPRRHASRLRTRSIRIKTDLRPEIVQERLARPEIHPLLQAAWQDRSRPLVRPKG